jgi:hypothetical protein
MYCVCSKCGLTWLVVVVNGLATITSTTLGQVLTYTSMVANTIPVVPGQDGGSSSSNAVAIGVGVGVGVPVFIIGCIAVLLLSRILNRPGLGNQPFPGHAVVLVNGNQSEK